MLHPYLHDDTISRQKGRRKRQNSPGLLLLEARLERRDAVLDDEGAQEDRQEPHVLDRLVAHQPSEQEPEQDGERRLKVSLLKLKTHKHQQHG